ncbi:MULTISPECIES: response regulator [Aminobacterium]|jgi:two-component system chemotaxis response regulator CheY|uniref:Response regulator receiver protein n=1 Tax=Aminobacterium colombiense (strain DSM 12261 / ALA-1) TaxID=572547 RepID=D5EGF0_AMICL|nr:MULTISPECIES: response regulator [Aminobacterium]MDD2378498.1 response regulator [Aminobacterium colombiense]ADE57632.1 response regulator receiver protein [Aminobacterium colombiense DSM 12261]MDD3768196.1 response regulator [Aminobacterium colombiense]MDD4265043.1 response regulator [Aminobacterium colombiense]MDD4586242.1 response regulator [Aminobacterium colombiense]
MGKRVLVVDDAVFMRIILKDILLNNNFEVVGEAENGKVAVEAYQRLHPDIVTMDISMPKMDGIDALRAIRALDPEAKIIMVSAMGQQPMVREAIKAGALDFIVKPFQPDRVVEALSRALA